MGKGPGACTVMALEGLETFCAKSLIMEKKKKLKLTKHYPVGSEKKHCSQYF